MAKNENEKQEKDSGLLLKSLVGAGIGYVGYRNRHALVSGAKNILSDASVRLSRAANGRAFRGAISDAKALGSALNEVYGDQTPGNLARTIFSKQDRSSQLASRFAAHERKKIGSQAASIPSDIKALQYMQSGIRANAKRLAERELVRGNIEKVALKDDRFKNIFGSDLGTAIDVLKNNPNLALYEVKSISSKDGKEQLNRKFVDALYENVEGVAKNKVRTFHLDGQNNEQVQSYYRGLVDLAKEANRAMLPEDVAALSRTFEMSAFHATRTAHSQDSKLSFFKKVLAENGVRANAVAQNRSKLVEAGLSEGAVRRSERFLGEHDFRPVTMDEARRLAIEERNGRLYAVQTSQKNSSGTIENYFSAEKNKIDANGFIRKEPGRVATDYISNGRRFGVSEEELGQDIFSQSLLFNEHTGELLSTASARELFDDTGDFFENYLQVPFLNINPATITQRQARIAKRNRPDFYIHQAGNYMSFLDQETLNLNDSTEYIRNLDKGIRKTNQAYAQVGDRLIDINISQEFSNLDDKEAYARFQEQLDNYTVAKNLTLVDTTHGVYKQHAEALSGLTNIEIEEQGGAFKKLFGLNQEVESNFSKLKRTLGKFDKESYAENLLPNILGKIEQEDVRPKLVSGGPDDLTVEKLIDRGFANLHGNTRNLSGASKDVVYDELSKALSEKTSRSINLWDMGSDEGTLAIAEEIYRYGRESSLYNDSIRSLPGKMEATALGNVTKTFESYSQNQTDFLNQSRFLKNRDFDIAEVFSYFEEPSQREVRAIDDLRRQIESFGLSVYENQGKTINELYGKSIVNGTFSKEAQSEINNLRALTQWDYFNRQAHDAVGNSVLDVRNELADFYKDNGSEAAQLQLAFRHAEPATGPGLGKEMDDLLESTKRTPIRQHQTMLENYNQQMALAAELVDSGESPFAAHAVAFGQFMKGQGQTFGEMFASKGGNVSTATTGAWFFANRLDTPLQKFGLGLSNDLKTSAQSILMNQWGRRIVLPYMAYQTAMYVDGLTGDAFSNTAADTYVNMHEDVNTLKEVTGFNQMGREFEKIAPWKEQIDEWFPVKALNAATFGLFSDSRSPEELREYYESGEDPIRKGRYWQIGSNSPWFGNKIDRYEPNWYRKLKSDYQFSENMYGSESEYWANNWMPTLTHPLAPLKHFVFDPYHYEKKHALDRPYAITGGFAELDNIPLIGPAVDSVVSGIFKPQIKNARLGQAHKEYLAAYNERLAAAYMNMNAGAAVQVSSGGGLQLFSDSYDLNIRDDEGELDDEALLMNANQFNAERDRMAMGLIQETGIAPNLVQGSGYGVSAEQLSSLEDYYGEGNIAPVGTSRIGPATGLAQAQLQAMNRRLTDGKTVNRNDMVSNAGNLSDPNTLWQLGNAINQQNILSPQGPLRDLTYNAGEFAGMYGFLSKTAFGFDESGRGATLESSERFSSYNNKFWENELGGLGGDFSEIFRRYLPRDPNKEYYNPIRNLMPTWLPGPGYFQDFLHGDPYAKIASGEMRLPGDAYEKLYNVRKDANGNYSALDRLRILADVAPYSDQYRAARKEVALLNQNGYLDEGQQEEYKNIRSQTSKRLKKKTWYEERFQNAEVRYENVTVKEVLDQNTFITEEYGDNPFKLAGVNVKSDDTVNKELIGQFIKAGQKLKVAIDTDPKRQIRDDLMETMRVVVYTPHAAKGSLLGLHGIGAGENLNHYLSKQTEENGGTVTIKDDGSATATQALFSEGQMTVGNMLERITHDILPNVPIMNVLTDKFLQVRSPVESYRRELYSKSWRDWKSPIEGWLKPMFETSTSKNPLIAFGTGYGIGYLAGKKNKGTIGLALGTLSGTMSGIRTLRDTFDNFGMGNGEAWIPERRQKERELDEYFDKLKYVKYRGLYEQASRIAKKEENFDLDAFFSEQKVQSEKNRKLKSYLEWQKKSISIMKKKGEGNEHNLDMQLADIKAQLDLISGERPTGKIGSYTALALRYKDEYESTLYGASQTSDYNKIYRALPSKDKQYFTAFQKASPRERIEILELVPKDQRIIYQKQFGMKVDELESLDSYFKKNPLPDEDWSGWNPSQSLDNIKIKVMKNEAMDLTEANYWGDDEKRADQTGNVEVPPAPGKLSVFFNKGELENVLRGAGLQDVRISLSSSPADGYAVHTDLNIEKDRSEEIYAGLEKQLQG